MRFQDIPLVNPKELGHRIREARERRGLSQEDFAARISRDQRAVSEYEHGKRRISVTELPVFAQVLDVPLLYFFEGETSPQDLDREILQYFNGLPSSKAKQSAIQLIRIFSEAFED
jgi:transcriptional regulator with XRE-family HTH domain